MFDLDFGMPPPSAMTVQMEAEPEVEQEEPEEPPPPTFSLEELSFARDAAFEEGRQAGLAEAQQQVDRLVADTLNALIEQVPALFRRQDDANEAHAREGVRVALAVIRKMLPAAAETHAFGEVTRVVEEVIGDLLDEPRIIVKVAEPLVDAVRQRLEAVCQAQGFEGRVVVQADDRMRAGDCRVEWTDGGAERDQERLLRDIEDAVENALAPPERRSVVAGDVNDESAGMEPVA